MRERYGNPAQGSWEDHPYPLTTVSDVFNLHEGTIPGWDGWEIEKHAKGLTLCSPLASAEELGFRDESNKRLRIEPNRIVLGEDVVYSDEI